MKNKLVFDGTPLRLYVEMYCHACGTCHRAYVSTSEAYGRFPELTVSKVEPIMYSFEEDGWFAHEGKWYCPKHEMKVVDR